MAAASCGSRARSGGEESRVLAAECWVAILSPWSGLRSTAQRARESDTVLMSGGGAGASARSPWSVHARPQESARGQVFSIAAVLQLGRRVRPQRRGSLPAARGGARDTRFDSRTRGPARGSRSARRPRRSAPASGASPADQSPLPTKSSCNRHSPDRFSALRRLPRVFRRAAFLQAVIFVPSRPRNLASQSGWAGQAGAVTKFLSTTALSMAMSANSAPASRTSGLHAG